MMIIEASSRNVRQAHTWHGIVDSIRCGTAGCWGTIALALAACVYYAKLGSPG